ncbi:MAG: orc1/cdc6 family replication initiation protein [Candidatus Thermoplasmatota archaeon]|nr:orc1/cdc6 family replication initiation protein [Candidatus Thermoplasmatota archaeon]
MKKKQSSGKNNVFDELMHEERIFKNREALASTYIPPEFPHRDTEINEVANILKPALYGARPSNILIYGQTGTGKTAVAKFICKQSVSKAVAEGKKIHTAYINCKQTNTPYGILTNIGRTYSRDWEERIPNAGWRIDKVYSALKERADEDGGIAIVVMDEVDTLVSKNGDEILYHLTGLNSDLDNSKISLIGISNDTKFTSWLDPRVKSRLGEESLTFAPYNALQIEDILSQRAKMAFHKNVVDPLVLSYCSSKAAQEHGDARKALDLLRISAEIAERDRRDFVKVKYVNKAQNVMEQDLVRNLVSTLPIQHKATLASIILNRGANDKVQQTTGEVYNTYNLICKRFKMDPLTQRRIGHIISELDMQGLINAKVVSLGRQGRTKFIGMAIEKSQIDCILTDVPFLSDIVEEMRKAGYLRSMQLRLI